MKHYGVVFCLSVVCAPLANAQLSLNALQEDGYEPTPLGECLVPNGYPAPTFSTATDLPVIVGELVYNEQNPEEMYTGVWTNWYRTPDMRVALGKLGAMRAILDANNLWDTYVDWYPQVPECPPKAANTRLIDGTCNDLDMPHMGAAGVRFGRNMDPKSAAAHQDPNMMVPNPREVSRNLFTRDTTAEVPFLNNLAVGWIQMMVHDWFDHSNSSHDFWTVPLAPEDPLYSPSAPNMYVSKTEADTTRKPWEAELGPTYTNNVTHWWDGSPLYGSDEATANRLRAVDENGNLKGELAIDAAGLLPRGEDGYDDTGFRENFWLGLGIMHTLFAHEHNSIVAMLRDTHPEFTEQELYDKARMINSVVMVKIHTIEWTPAILPNPTLEVGMNINWSGLNQYLDPPLPAVPDWIPAPYKHIVYGLRGNDRELHTQPDTGNPVPFTLTEEFVSVYRMHPLLATSYEIRSAEDNSLLQEVPLSKTRLRDGRKLEERYGIENLAYSFGVSRPGALVLHNYPQELMDLKIPHVGRLDLGTVDIVRDRERGVPRFNEFRRQMQLKPLASIDQLTDDPDLRRELKDVYGYDEGAIERVDLLVGTLAEASRPDCYGFGETAFQVFVVMASRRIHGDLFLTEKYNADSYTQEGLDWIEAATMKNVLLRQYPGLANTGLAKVTNAFFPWDHPVLTQ